MHEGLRNRLHPGTAAQPRPTSVLLYSPLCFSQCTRDPSLLSLHCTKHGGRQLQGVTCQRFIGQQRDPPLLGFSVGIPGEETQLAQLSSAQLANVCVTERQTMTTATEWMLRLGWAGSNGHASHRRALPTEVQRQKMACHQSHSQLAADRSGWTSYATNKWQSLCVLHNRTLCPLNQVVILLIQVSISWQKNIYNQKVLQLFQKRQRGK